MIPRPFTLLRKDLRDPVPRPSWPAGTRPAPFDPERDAAAAHGLLERAYAQGGGQVAAFELWWPNLRADPDYDPALVFLACDQAGELIGIVFTVFRGRLAPFLDLKVESGNPSGAGRLYRRLGMRPEPPLA